MVSFLINIEIILLIIVSGCATTRQLVPKIELGKCPSDKACVYVIRPAAIWGAGMHYAVKDNDKEIGLTGPRSYLAWQREPGQVHIWSRGFNEYTTNFYASAGETYYILQFVDTLNGEYGGISLISKEEALKYLKSCHPAK